MKTNPWITGVFDNWPIKIVCVAAALLLFLFHDLTSLSERYFSVPLEVRSADSFAPASPFPARVRVSLKGAEQAIFSIQEEDVRAYVDLGRYGGEGVFNVPVLLEKTGSAEAIDPLEIRLEPGSLNLSLERRVRRRVEVLPTVKGIPAAGFGLDQYTVNPSVVEVEGPRTRIEGLAAITTEEIDIGGRRESFVARSRLVRRDPLVRIPGSDSVEFRATISELVVLRSFEDVTIQAANLNPSLRIVSILPRGSLDVRGLQLNFDAAEPPSLGLAVDCTGVRKPGTYTLPVKADVPAGFVATTWAPAEVVLEFGPASRKEN